MADEKRTILHMEYRYKDEATGQYITGYFENDLRDVQIPEELQDRFFGATNMLDFTSSLMSKLQTLNPKTVRKLSTEIVATEVYAEGQVVYETDTRKYKIGDGVTQYQFLSYGKAEEDEQILTNNISDVKLNDTQQDRFFGASTVEEFFASLMYKLQSFTPKTIMLYSYQFPPTKVYDAGQLIYEIDTKKLKIADGHTQYQFLQYTAGGSGDSGESADQQGNVSNTDSIEYPASSNIEVFVENNAVSAEIGDTDDDSETVDIDALEVLSETPTDGRNWYAEQTS